MRFIFYSIFVLFFISNKAISQATMNESGGIILLYKNDGESPEGKLERGSYNDSHQLGDSISSLLNEVEKSYIYYSEETGAYSTKEKKIEKNGIYYPLQKVIKHYDKQLKKDKINEAKAYSDLVVILNNGIALKNYQTDQFELLLKNTKNKDELARLFKEVKLK